MIRVRAQPLISISGRFPWPRSTALAQVPGRLGQRGGQKEFMLSSSTQRAQLDLPICLFFRFSPAESPASRVAMRSGPMGGRGPYFWSRLDCALLVIDNKHPCPSVFSRWCMWRWRTARMRVQSAGPASILHAETGRLRSDCSPISSTAAAESILLAVK